MVWARDEEFRRRESENGGQAEINREGRPRGRPKKRWMDGTEQDLEQLVITNWEETVHNREEWKEVSVAVKTHEEL